MKNKPKTNVQIIDYSDKYQAAFRALNEERTSKQYAIKFFNCSFLPPSCLNSAAKRETHYSPKTIL
ncbi:hypothetical protein OCK74_27435 [Chitinophagaceae bacterium LB-8]|uniref:Uncharacterized protein n=1 Tax=Paraflavisolibacter caeni TaxID=2982496 RepID=A0A9X2XQ37_9BACT|nr:hypothetical protein [Paraflavisolibacter caeni]MCU7552883.1 hypothetical protein [Paraflavisolibacter caeni]